MEMSKIPNDSNMDNDAINKTDLNNSLNELLGLGKNLTILSYKNCETVSIHTNSHTDISNLVQLIEENKYEFTVDNNESNISDILKTANVLNIDGLRRIITQKKFTLIIIIQKNLLLKNINIQRNIKKLMIVPSKSLPPLPAGSDFFATPSWKFFNV